MHIRGSLFECLFCMKLDTFPPEIQENNKILVLHVFKGEKCQYSKQEIVLFKSLRNSKRRNKGNFTSKSKSNKIKLCGGGGQHYLVLIKISTL